MGIFEGLSEKIGHVFSKLKNRGKLTELEIKQAMREIRIALLEADVNITVAKDFINKVTEKAVGQEILKSLTPAQQVIKIVNEELTALMGSSNSRLNISSSPPTIYMVCGLQGAGKTTVCGKLAYYLRKQGKKPLVVACDIYRPAAIKQLEIMVERAGADFFEKGQTAPVKIVKEALEYAQKYGNDYIIIDTAGRLHIDEELMKELEDISGFCKPHEILLTVDAMIGQEAVNVADTFNKRLEITGIIMTKLDGDTRGGSTLSVKAVTGKPIKLCSMGEKIGDLEPFYPDRIAGRILGMGDMLTLIEKAQETVTEEQLKKYEKKLKENSFTLQDYLEQFESMKKLGSISDILSMIPGMGRAKISEKDIDEKKITRFKAIIQSMTPQERENPAILNSSRKRRISQGSGTTVQEVNQLLNQYEQVNQIMKQLKGKKRFPFM
jgi:signal recognition particle subunit SRP54